MRSHRVHFQIALAGFAVCVVAQVLVVHFSAAAKNARRTELLHLAPLAAEIMRRSAQDLNPIVYQSRSARQPSIQYSQSPRKLNDDSAVQAARLLKRSKRDHEKEMIANQHADKLLQSYSHAIDDSLDWYTKTSGSLHHSKQSTSASKNSNDGGQQNDSTPKEVVQQSSRIQKDLVQPSDVRHSTKEIYDFGSVDPFEDQAKIWQAAGLSEDNIFGVPGRHNDEFMNRIEKQAVASSRSADYNDQNELVAAQAVPIAMDGSTIVSGSETKGLNPENAPRSTAHTPHGQQMPVKIDVVRNLAQSYMKESDESRPQLPSKREQDHVMAQAAQSMQNAKHLDMIAQKQKQLKEDIEKLQVKELQDEISSLKRQLTLPSQSQKIHGHPTASLNGALAPHTAHRRPHATSHLHEIAQPPAQKRAAEPAESPYVRVCNGFGCHLNRVAGVASRPPKKPAVKADIKKELDETSPDEVDLDKVLMPWEGAFESEVYLDKDGQIRARHGDPHGVLTPSSDLQPAHYPNGDSHHAHGEAGDGEGIAPGLFMDDIVTAQPGFNDGLGRHVRAQEAADFKRNWETRRRKVNGVVVG